MQFRDMASLAPIFAKMESTGGVQCAGGVTDIKQEIQCTTANQQFVLHDSQGFEPGEVENLRIVQDFLRSRNKNVDIREQVDVVWYVLRPIASAIDQQTVSKVMYAHPQCGRSQPRYRHRKIPRPANEREIGKTWVILSLCTLGQYLIASG